MKKLSLLFLFLAISPAGYGAEQQEYAIDPLRIADNMSLHASTGNTINGCKGMIKGKGMTGECSGEEIAEITEEGDMFYRGEFIGEWSTRVVLTYTNQDYELKTYSNIEEWEAIYKSL
jgi:hypothetical protein